MPAENSATPSTSNHWSSTDLPIMFSKKQCSTNDNKKTPFVCTETCFESHGHAIFGTAFNPYLTEDQYPVFATVGSNQIAIYELPFNEKRKISLKYAFKDTNKQESYYAVSWSLDVSNGNHLLCVGGEVGIIRIMDVAKGRFIKNLYGHGGLINEIRTHPLEPSIIASVSKDQSCRVWHVEREGCLVVIGGFNGHRDQILSLDFSYCGNYVVTSSMDHTVKLWRISKDAQCKINQALGLPDKKIDEKLVADFPDEHDLIRDFMKINRKFIDDEEQNELRVDTARRITRERGLRDPTIYFADHRLSVNIHFPCANTGDLHRNYVDCVRIMGEFIISKSSEDCIHVWKFGNFPDGVAGWDKTIASETAVSHLSRLNHPDCDNWFVKFELDPRKKWIACGNKIGEIAFWSTDKRRPNEDCDFRLQVLREPATLRQVAFEPYGRCLIAVGDDASVSRIDRVLENQMPPQSKKRTKKRKDSA